MKCFSSWVRKNTNQLFDSIIQRSWNIIFYLYTIIFYILIIYLVAQKMKILSLPKSNWIRVFPIRPCYVDIEGQGE